MKIQESAENYLERILMLRKQKGFARSVDIAGELGVTKPSVSYAMKQLRENGYITTDSDGHISLTDTGLAIALRIYERHRLLAQFFMSLGVPEKTAYEDACKIEHDLSDESFGAICAHMGETPKDQNV